MIQQNSIHSTLGAGRFTTTLWSKVLLAARPNEPQAREALAKLCQTYWKCLYVFIRRKGYSSYDAQDLTQEFFAYLFQHELLEVANPARGRFRCYLLTLLQHFLANKWHHDHALKRGGCCEMLPLNIGIDGEPGGCEPADDFSPEKAYDRHWARMLLQRVLERLERDYLAAGKSELFTALRDRLWEDSEAQSYAQVSAQLGISQPTARMAACRLRQRFREILLEELRQVASCSAQVQDELMDLLAALA